MIIYIINDGKHSLYRTEDFKVITYKDDQIIGYCEGTGFGSEWHLVRNIDSAAANILMNHIAYCMTHNKNYIRISIDEGKLISLDYEGCSINI